MLLILVGIVAFRRREWSVSPGGPHVCVPRHRRFLAAMTIESIATRHGPVVVSTNNAAHSNRENRGHAHSPDDASARRRYTACFDVDAPSSIVGVLVIVFLVIAIVRREEVSEEFSAALIRAECIGRTGCTDVRCLACLLPLT
jgi:hypothetical protein